MIEVAPDVNFFLDACRFRDSFSAAVDSANDRMKLLMTVNALGARSGVRLHTGDHVLSNIRRALRNTETSVRQVTREAWSSDDIDDFVTWVVEIVEKTGGEAHSSTCSHSTALGRFASAGAPDAEDYQMLVLANSSPATVLATMDEDLLAVGEFNSVEVWKSSEVEAEVRATVRRLQQQPAGR